MRDLVLPGRARRSCPACARCRRGRARPRSPPRSSRRRPGGVPAGRPGRWPRGARAAWPRCRCRRSAATARAATVPSSSAPSQDPCPQGRDGIETGGAVTGHGRGDGTGVGRVEQHDHVAGLPLLQGDGPRPHVRERVGAHHGTARLEQRTGVAAQHVDPVREHGALGPAGAAAGEEDHVGIVLVDDGRRRGVVDLTRQGRQAGSRRGPLGPVAGEAHGAGERRSQARRQGLTALGVLGVDDHQGGAGRGGHVVASSRPSPAPMGANTAPVLASAANSGTRSRVVELHTTTRSPRRTPRPARTRATRLAASSTSAKVTVRSPRAAAARWGTARAALEKMSPTVSCRVAGDLPSRSRTVILEWKNGCCLTGEQSRGHRRAERGARMPEMTETPGPSGAGAIRRPSATPSTWPTCGASWTPPTASSSAPAASTRRCARSWPRRASRRRPSTGSSGRRTSSCWCSSTTAGASCSGTSSTAWPGPTSPAGQGAGLDRGCAGPGVEPRRRRPDPPVPGQPGPAGRGLPRRAAGVGRPARGPVWSVPSRSWPTTGLGAATRRAARTARRDAEAVYRLVFATLHDHLARRTRPSPDEVDHLVGFALRALAMDPATAKAASARRRGARR